MNYQNHFSPIIFVSSEDSEQHNQVIEFLNHSGNKDKLIPDSVQTKSINWINTENESIKIKTVRDLQHQISYSQTSLQTHVLLHAEKTTLPAQNALLKLLEEPPEWQFIILSTTSPHTLLPTIISRCRIIYENKSVDVPQSTQSEEILSQLRTASYSDCIELAKKYKDRPEAELLLVDLLITTNFLLEKDQNSRLLTVIQALQQGLDDIKSNSNVTLSLEHCFFTISTTNT